MKMLSGKQILWVALILVGPVAIYGWIDSARYGAYRLGFADSAVIDRYHILMKPGWFPYMKSTGIVARTFMGWDTETVGWRR